MKKKKNYTISSGNIFADLGIANPEEHLAKAELAYQINTLIQEKELTQQQAAQLLGIDQPKICALYKGKLSGFSLERLFRFLNILGQKITIKISPKKRSDSGHEATITFTNLRKVSLRKSSSNSNTRAVHAKKKR